MTKNHERINQRNMHIPKGKTETKTRNGGTEHDEESRTDQSAF